MASSRLFTDRKLITTTVDVFLPWVWYWWLILRLQLFVNVCHLRLILVEFAVWAERIDITVVPLAQSALLPDNLAFIFLLTNLFVDMGQLFISSNQTILDCVGQLLILVAQSVEVLRRDMSPHLP